MTVAEWDADMKKDAKNSTFRIALCSIISALSVVLLLLTSVIPFGTFAVPCMAGLCVIAIVIEYGSKWAFGVFAVVSLLSLFLAGDKESVLFFIALFGHYPIIKGLIESKIKSRVVQYIFKLIVFNVGAIAAFFAGTFLLSISAEEYTLFGVYMPLAFLLAGNLFFVLYDFAITSMVGYYVCNLRNKVFRKKQ